MTNNQQSISSDYDVVVIGGGPAGSTVSTLLAQQGVRVGLFERERFPRFHIGESLIPETYWVLKRLNMLPKMQRSHFVKKYSGFVNSTASRRRRSTSGTTPHECSDVAGRRASSTRCCRLTREHGVDAHEGVHVGRSQDAIAPLKAVGVRIQPAGEPRRQIRAKVVDASARRR